MKRLILAALVAATVLAVPATASASPDVLDYCGESATGWEIWVDREDADCAFARATYREARKYQRSHAVREGDRFTLRVRYRGASYRVVCKVLYDGDRFTIEVRERGLGVEAEFVF